MEIIMEFHKAIHEEILNESEITKVIQKFKEGKLDPSKPKAVSHMVGNLLHNKKPINNREEAKKIISDIDPKLLSNKDFIKILNIAGYPIEAKEVPYGHRPAHLRPKT